MANIAEVCDVMAASIFSGSILKVSGSISVKTGLQPSQTIELVVATNEKGVVIISPFNSYAFICSFSPPY